MTNSLIVYEAPKGAIERNDFSVKVRSTGQEWQQLFVYEVKVDMHNVRSSFDGLFRHGRNG